MRVLAIVALFCFSGAALAADEKKPSGSWSKTYEGFEIKFTFKKDNVLVFTMDNGNDGCTMESKCTFEKDGVVKCEVTNFDTKGNFPVKKDKGYKFSFKIETVKDEVRITKFEGQDIGDEQKAILESAYQKAKD